MTPIHLSRLNFNSNQLLNISNPSSLLLSVIVKIKAAALIMIPIIAVFFLYLIFSDPKGTQPTASSIGSFSRLTLSSDDKKSIEFILENLAQKSKWWLYNHSSEMNMHGDKINDTHPLRFISFILSDNRLKNTHLPAILNDRFKKMSFMRGLSQSLDKMHKNGLLKPYLSDFMKSLKISLSETEKLTTLIDEKNWHSFFHCLIGGESS